MLPKKDYVAGFIENVGGFYILRGKTPQFKIVIQKSNFDKLKTVSFILDYLLVKEGIKFNSWESLDKHIYQLTNMVMLEKMIDFIERECLITKKSQDEVKNLITVKRQKYELRKKNTTR
jgi:hypothetical protein